MRRTKSWGNIEPCLPYVQFDWLELFQFIGKAALAIGQGNQFCQIEMLSSSSMTTPQCCEV